MSETLTNVKYESRHLFLELDAVPVTKANRNLGNVYKFIRDRLPLDLSPIKGNKIEISAVFEFEPNSYKKYRVCDIDNLIKTVIDALKGVVFIGDDRIVTKIEAEKKMSYRNMTTLYITNERI